jgi:ribosomal protein L40E
MPSLPPGVSLDDEIAAYDLRVAALAEPPVAMPAPEPLRPAALRAPVPEPLYQAQPPVAHLPAMDHAAPALPPIYVPGPVPELPEASPVAQPASQTTGSCASCGLSLSATARFCRRCGTPQHLD